MPHRKHLTGRTGFVSDHSCRLQSIVTGKSWWQELITFKSKGNEACVLPGLLMRGCVSTPKLPWALMQTTLGWVFLHQ